MPNTPTPAIPGHVEELRELFEELAGFVLSDHAEAPALDKVERGIWRRVLQIGRAAMSGFLAAQGDGDEGPCIIGPQGQNLKRFKSLHRRLYLSVCGEFAIERAVYGTREGQKIESVPLDVRLQLPRGKFSYLLQEWNDSLALEMPFDQCSSVIERILGFRQSVHSLERSNRCCAEAVEAFWEDQPTPPPEQEGALLVCSADGKGVPMRRADSAPPLVAPASGGMRPGDKKMGLVGAVYSVDPYVRTPQQIVDALFRTGEGPTQEPGRPKPGFKRVRAALKRDHEDTTAPQVQAIFGWIASEVQERGQGGDKPLVLLMDGQESLWNAGLEHLPVERFEVVEILDLLHAASYVWKAVRLFHPDQEAGAERLARKQILRLLSGELPLLIRSLRGKANRCGLSGKKRDDLERIIGYFLSNAERMDYQRFLAAGYPIASGVIEGACRTVIKDRMERSGMRWVFDGAHAMMGLRSIGLSSLWDEFLEYRIRNETQRLYPQAAANDDHAGLALRA